MNLARRAMAFLYFLWQNVVLALEQIWSNKMRSLLTMLGIVIGVASTTAVIAALTGLKTKVLSEFERFGTNRIAVYPTWPQSGPMRHASWLQIRFSPELFENMLDFCPSVETFTRIQDYNVSVRRNEFALESVRVQGIDPGWHKINNRSTTLGRPFSLIDNQEARYVCLINPVAQEKLRLDRDCTGQSILVGEYRFTVVGVVEPAMDSALFGNRQSGAEVLIPFTTLRRIRSDGWMRIEAYSRSPEVSLEAQAEIEFFLRSRRHLKPGEPNTFFAVAVEKHLQEFNSLALMLTLVAVGIVGISLIVGGVGIMNIMLVSVSERTREIGLRKAIGARPSAIMLQFLVEAVMLCFLGGIIGLAGGHGLAYAVSNIPGAKLDHASVPGWAVLLAFGFSAFVGLAFGMFPAIKAARLDPIDALRHE